VVILCEWLELNANIVLVAHRFSKPASIVFTMCILFVSHVLYVPVSISSFLVSSLNTSYFYSLTINRAINFTVGLLN